jgi:hypothetical protein
MPYYKEAKAKVKGLDMVYGDSKPKYFRYNVQSAASQIS